MGFLLGEVKKIRFESIFCKNIGIININVTDKKERDMITVAMRRSILFIVCAVGLLFGNHNSFAYEPEPSVATGFWPSVYQGKIAYVSSKSPYDIHLYSILDGTDAVAVHRQTGDSFAWPMLYKNKIVYQNLKYSTPGLYIFSLGKDNQVGGGDDSGPTLVPGTTQVNYNSSFPSCSLTENKIVWFSNLGTYQAALFQVSLYDLGQDEEFSGDDIGPTLLDSNAGTSFNFPYPAERQNKISWKSQGSLVILDLGDNHQYDQDDVKTVNPNVSGFAATLSGDRFLWSDGVYHMAANGQDKVRDCVIPNFQNNQGVPPSVDSNKIAWQWTPDASNTYNVSLFDLGIDGSCGTIDDYSEVLENGSPSSTDHIWRVGVSISGDMIAYNYQNITNQMDPATVHVVDYMPPVLNPLQNQVVVGGQELDFDVTGMDPGGDAVKITATGLPDGATLTDHGDGTASFEWATSLSQKGTFTVTFQVSSGVRTASQSMTITVKKGKYIIG